MSIARVLLVRVPSFVVSAAAIGEIRTRGGVTTYPPLAAVTLAARLQRRPELQVRILDLEFAILRQLRDDPQATGEFMPLLRQELTAFCPDLVGISVIYSRDHQNALLAAAAVKEHNPSIVVCAGGVHATFAARELLAAGTVDYLLTNEADETLGELVDHLNDARPAAQLRGTCTRAGKCHPYAGYPNDLDCVPAWELIDLPAYIRYCKFSGIKNISDASVTSAVMQTSRGCRAACTFCSVRAFNGKGIRSKSVAGVLAEVDVLCRRHGVRQLEIVDDDFTADRERVLAICRGLIDRKYDLIWTLDNGVRLLTLDREVLDHLVRAGCRLISIGLESGNAEMLRQIRKPVTVEAAYRQMTLLHEYNRDLYVKGNIIVGFPGETREQVDDTFRVAAELAFDWVPVSIFTPLVGTAEYAAFARESRRDLGGGDFQGVSFGQTMLPPPGFTAVTFESYVYRKNVETNFLKNANYNGRNPVRAQRDFRRIVAEICPDHAIAWLCLARLAPDPAEAKKCEEQYARIIRESPAWAALAVELGLAA